MEVSFGGGGSRTLARLAKKNISFAWRQWRRPLEPSARQLPVEGVDAARQRALQLPELYWAAVNHPVTVV